MGVFLSPWLVFKWGLPSLDVRHVVGSSELLDLPGPGWLAVWQHSVFSNSATQGNYHLIFSSLSEENCTLGWAGYIWLDNNILFCMNRNVTANDSQHVPKYLGLNMFGLIHQVHKNICKHQYAISLLEQVIKKYICKAVILKTFIFLKPPTQSGLGKKTVKHKSCLPPVTISSSPSSLSYFQRDENTLTSKLNREKELLALDLTLEVELSCLGPWACLSMPTVQLQDMGIAKSS